MQCWVTRKLQPPDPLVDAGHGERGLVPQREGDQVRVRVVGFAAVRGAAAAGGGLLVEAGAEVAEVEGLGRAGGRVLVAEAEALLHLAQLDPLAGLHWRELLQPLLCNIIRVNIHHTRRKVSFSPPLFSMSFKKSSLKSTSHIMFPFSSSIFSPMCPVTY